MGNKQVVSAIGIGTIDIITKQEQSYTLVDVLHAPGIGFNLFSLREVTRKKYTVIMDDDDLYVYFGPDLYLTGKAIGDKSYKMHFDVKSKVLACPARPKPASIEVWHQRLGHTNFETVKRMIKDDEIIGLTCNECKPPEACEACIIAKMTRKSFPPSVERAEQPGELIHFDIAGPFETISLGHATYLSLFVDDLSGMTFVQPLRLKSDIINALQHVMAIVRAQGHQLKRLRSDNALEFVCRAMDEVVHKMELSTNTLLSTAQNRIDEQNAKIGQSLK